jgi:hypothetical protein
MGIDTFFVERHSLVRAVHRSAAECDTISFRFSFIWRGFAMDSQIHWDKVYAEKAPTAMSWYRQHLETSLSLLERVASKEDAIIDVGGGESTLVDDLLSHGTRVGGAWIRMHSRELKKWRDTVKQEHDSLSTRGKPAHDPTPP